MAPTAYRNFDLLLARAGARDKATIVDALAGEVRSGFDLSKGNA